MRIQLDEADSSFFLNSLSSKDLDMAKEPDRPYIFSRLKALGCGFSA
jgi:hypothetical protein